MFLYDINKTMRMIGRNCAAELLCGDGVATEDFKNVLDAHEKNGTYSLFDIGIDAFMLGYIYGKRAERARRR